MSDASPPRRSTRANTPLIRFVRLWLPLIIIAAGIALALSLRTDAAWEGGALLVSAGLSVWLLNALFRLGVRGDADRRREQRAREYFERHGRWPDEDATPASGPRRE